jgi:pimeloyl-ACP methyl ester carboxylesterase
MPRGAIGNLTMHYQQVGKGPDLVLIHGLCSNLALWYLSIVPRLADSFRITVYDLRGHGLSQVAPSGYRAVDLADDLKALIDHLNIETAHIVSHSFGGAIALAFARRYPDRLSTLTLADAWVPTLQPSPFNMDPEHWLQVRAKLTDSGVDIDYELPRVAHGFVEELIEQRHNPDTRGGSLEALESMFGKGQSPVVRRWVKLVRTTSAAAEFSDCSGIAVEDLRRIEHPISIAFGARSRYLSTMRGLRRALRNSRCTVIPNAGHFFPFFYPNVIVQIIMQSAFGDVVSADKTVVGSIASRVESERESERAQERR